MRMNALIPMQGQSPDLVGSFYRGAQVREGLAEARRADELRNALAQHGAGLMTGDRNALAAVAQYDPTLAFEFQKGHNEERRADANERRRDEALALDRRNTESSIADRSARLKMLEQQAAQQAAQASREDKIQAYTMVARVLPQFEAAQTPEEWDRLADAIAPDAKGNFERRDEYFAIGRGLLAATAPEGDTPASVQEYQFAQQQGEARPYSQWLMETKKAGATSVNVSTGENGLQKELDGEEAKVWSGYLKTGTVAASNAGDFQVLGELIKVAPQGPLTGRLAEALPGVSSAGDAFNSIVKRVAPTLRAEGSGATSDIEYDGMLRSLPALRNQPEANAMILQIMGAKNQINMERAEIVRQFRNREIDATQARRAMSELDARSIMTPEMRSALAGIGVPGGDPGAPSATTSGIQWKVLD